MRSPQVAGDDDQVSLWAGAERRSRLAKNIEHVENMSYSIMGAGQMDSQWVLLLAYRLGESGTPSAERMSRGGELHSESAPPCWRSADR